MALEEIKFLQKQREKKSGIPALLQAGGVNVNVNGSLVTKGIEIKNEVDGENDELVLQDTFAQETAVMVEDPNMYVCFYIMLRIYSTILITNSLLYLFRFIFL